VFKRNEEKQPVKPNFSSSLLTLPDAALTAFQRRITQALGHKSSGIEMSINDDSPNSFFQKSATAIYSDVDSFIKTTCELSTDLAKVQAAKDLGASKLIFISGRAGVSDSPYKAVIKAELSDGFAESGDTLQYLEDLFLTPTQKLYKIGFIHNIATMPPSGAGQYDPANFKAYLFDHLLTQNETRDAAHYFYAGFLGMKVMASDKRLTCDFFENTKSYVNTMPVDQDRKVALLEALRSELRSNKATLQVSSFAKDHFSESERGGFIDFMTHKGSPTNSFSKSLDYIAHALKKRQQMKFSNNVTLTAPSDQLHQLVKVTEVTAEHTILKVQGTIEVQE
jgi:hypothetical protein